MNPRSGAAGTSVLVSANGYEATSEGGAGPVQIRWNSLSGPILASASGPSFSTNVTIPESAGARTYYIVAVQESSSGATRTASAAFTVTSSGASEPAPAEAQPEPQPQPPAQQEPAPAPARNDTAAAPDAAAVGAPAAAKAPISATAARRPSARVAPAARRTAPERAGSRGPGASAVPASETTALTATPAAEPTGEVAALPSGRTVSSDVWSGFSDGATSRGPSLVDRTNSTTGSGDVGLGLGLIGLGTVGFFGATAVGLRLRSRGKRGVVRRAARAS